MKNVHFQTQAKDGKHQCEWRREKCPKSEKHYALVYLFLK